MALSAGDGTDAVGAGETLVGVGPISELDTKAADVNLAEASENGVPDAVKSETETAAVPPPQLPDENDGRPISKTLPPLDAALSSDLEQQYWASSAAAASPESGWSWSLALLWTAAIMAAATAAALFVMR